MFNNIADGNDSYPKRKKSKISIHFEEYKNRKKEYDNFIKEEIDEENDLNEFNEFNCNEADNINFSYDNNENNILNNLRQFEVYFYFKINDSKEFIFPIQTDFFNIKEEYGYDLIKNIIKKINDKKLIVENNSIKYIISLKDCEDENNKEFYIKNYELKYAKKRI